MAPMLGVDFPPRIVRVTQIREENPARTLSGGDGLGPPRPKVDEKERDKAPVGDRFGRQRADPGVKPFDLRPLAVIRNALAGLALSSLG